MMQRIENAMLRLPSSIRDLQHMRNTIICFCSSLQAISYFTSHGIFVYRIAEVITVVTHIVLPAWVSKNVRRPNHARSLILTLPVTKEPAASSLDIPLMQSSGT